LATVCTKVLLTVAIVSKTSLGCSMAMMLWAKLVMVVAISEMTLK
jgi:hypothetical protein